ncbi:MAG: alkaline phosphatase family protein, partial [Caulobacteraceae bacterium]
MRSWLALACLCALLAGRAAAADPPPPRPKLIVVIAVDQLSLELFERYRPTFTGGLRRLGQGLAFTGYQSHAATETCPGHSTILTGDHPARTGMVANSWYDRASGSTVYCVSVHGVSDPLARGPGMLRVDTLGDWLKQQRPGARSIAVSGKDRAAITLAGHHPDAVYWWNDGLGFSTSAHAGPATAAVLGPARAFDRALFAGWRRRPPQLWPTEVPGRCGALERPLRVGRLQMSGRVPPDGVKDAEQAPAYLATSRFSEELRASPSFDPLTLSFAAELVRTFRLGRGPQADLLAVSLSSTDYIGHRYGNGGAETCVQLAALDAALGEFLEGLDRIGTPYVAVLTADHGAIDAPERLGPPARRIDVAGLGGALNGRLRQTFGLTYDPLAGEDPNQLVINLAPADDRRRDMVVREAVAWLAA